MNSVKNFTNLAVPELATETVEMTEVDGIQQGAVLRFMHLSKGSSEHQEEEIHTCLGDIYVTVNALRDYAALLERAVKAWKLTGFQESTYNLHAARCRKIADKYAGAVGYDYDAALERCRKRRAQASQRDDTGMDGVEALVRKQQRAQNQKEKIKGNTK